MPNRFLNYALKREKKGKKGQSLKEKWKVNSKFTESFESILIWLAVLLMLFSISLVEFVKLLAVFGFSIIQLEFEEILGWEWEDWVCLAHCKKNYKNYPILVLEIPGLKWPLWFSKSSYSSFEFPAIFASGTAMSYTVLDTDYPLWTLCPVVTNDRHIMWYT